MDRGFTSFEFELLGPCLVSGATLFVSSALNWLRLPDHFKQDQIGDKENNNNAGEPVSACQSTSEELALNGPLLNV